MEKDTRAGARTAHRAAGNWIYPTALCGLNVLVSWRLFRIEYLDQLQSIEGVFIALARYIQHERAWNNWFSLWYAGMPFARVYQPALHYAVAGVATLFRLSPAVSYHALIAIAYALGPVALYWLGTALSGSKPASFCAALVFSLFSPSLLFIGLIRADTGGLWNPRRLQALVVYGEAPNILGLALGMIALAMLHRAITRRTAAFALAAAISLAAVPANNWPSTIALLMGVAAYLAALPLKQIRSSLGRIAAIGCMAACLASPFALPSTVVATFDNTHLMGDSPTPGLSRWISIFVLLACVAVGRDLLLRLRAPLVLRFAILQSVLVGGIVVADAWFGVRLIPLPFRFHLAMEIGLALSMAFPVAMACARWPRVRPLLIVALVLAGGVQFLNYRRYARQIIKPVAIQNTIEFQTADWFDRNMHGERVAAFGSISFWMNAFTDTPQLHGCCEQSYINPENRAGHWLITKGYKSDQESADYSLLWLKAAAVHAIAIGGPNSREHYKDPEFPYRFEGRLPLAWQQGDDRIFRVPERANGLARVVPLNAVVRHAPADGIDVAELRMFVAALDNPALPVLETKWQAPDHAVLQGTLTPDQTIAVAVNFDRGWSASANGNPARVFRDGLGFLTIEPNCSGPCEVELRWNGGWEPRIAVALALLAVVAGMLLINRRTGKMDIDPPATPNAS